MTINYIVSLCHDNPNHPYSRFTSLPEPIFKKINLLVLVARGSGVPAMQAQMKLERLCTMSDEEIIKTYQKFHQ